MADTDTLLKVVLEKMKEVGQYPNAASYTLNRNKDQVSVERSLQVPTATNSGEKK